MEDKNSFKNNSNLSKVLVFLSIVAFSVIIGGLFFSSRPAVNNRMVETSAGPQEIFFTAAVLPEKLDFADEAVPLENFDVRESLDREMLIVTNFHSQELLYLKKTNRYFSIIEPILKKNDIPDDFKFLALAESGFFDKIVSPAGAVGIWQFMKDAAIQYGLEVNGEIDERYHIEKATEAACKYLRHSFEIYKSWTMVAASYNAGVAGMNRQIDVQDSRNYYDLLLNEETSRYMFRILSLKLVISDPEKYGFKISDDEKYPIIPFKEVKVAGSVKSFTEFARANNINYKLFKQFNPWLRQPDLKNPKGKIYTVKIPEVGKYRKFVFAESSDLQ
ncbi:MAG TPA: lytic transglycosylase domain-containing protein [Prolixibacteraceae bacterium]|nr:lytic transglycosylase domain-containing protein [Prolixibacteraceae bacterium]